jgi:hypothetical protein
VLQKIVPSKAVVVWQSVSVPRVLQKIVLLGGQSGHVIARMVVLALYMHS